MLKGVAKSLLVCLLVLMSSDSGDAKAPLKNGAGFFFVTPSGHVLLLQRVGNHNAGTWGLPGGNVDATDKDLIATAHREAEEELGKDAVPKYEISGQGILTRRGKSDSKHYTVFVAKVHEQLLTSFAAPNLNTKEHSAYKWFPISDLGRLEAEGKLHPVVRKLLKHHRAELAAAAGVPVPDAM